MARRIGCAGSANVVLAMCITGFGGFLKSRNHCPIKALTGVGRRRIMEIQGGIGAHKIGEGYPCREVCGNLNMAV
jgi:hypothetical protein